MMNYIQRKRNKKGFTLIELLVVMAIIAILVAIGLLKMQEATKTAKKTAHEANQRSIKSAVMLYTTTNNPVNSTTGKYSFSADASGNLTGDDGSALAKFFDGGKLPKCYVANSDGANAWQIKVVDTAVASVSASNSTFTPALTIGDISVRPYWYE